MRALGVLLILLLSGCTTPTIETTQVVHDRPDWETGDWWVYQQRDLTINLTASRLGTLWMVGGVSLDDGIALETSHWPMWGALTHDLNGGQSGERFFFWPLARGSAWADASGSTSVRSVDETTAYVEVARDGRMVMHFVYDATVRWFTEIVDYDSMGRPGQPIRLLDHGRGHAGGSVHVETTHEQHLASPLDPQGTITVAEAFEAARVHVDIDCARPGTYALRLEHEGGDLQEVATNCPGRLQRTLDLQIGATDYTQVVVVGGQELPYVGEWVVTMHDVTRY